MGEAKRRYNVDAFVPALPPDSSLLALPFGGEVLRRLGFDRAEVNSLIEEQRRAIYQEDVGHERISMSDKAIRQAFSIVDTDGNGLITPNEMEKAIDTLDLDLTESEIHNMFTKEDLDKAGGITFQEFEGLMGDRFVKYWW